MVMSEKCPHLLGHCRDVHRAEQRQPSTRRGTESRDLTLWIDHRFRRIGVDCAAGAKARGDHAWRHIARADGPHHVVAAASRDDDVIRKAIFRRQLRQENPGGLV